MSKYYAVKTGRVPGVYSTWKECEEQVKGYKGASFKSFSTQDEALRFVQPLVSPSSTEDLCIIYTDGSHQRGKNYLGIGAFCQYRDKEYTMSLSCDDTMLNSYRITESNCSNATAEFLAVAEVLKVISSGSPYRENLSIMFMNDYVGPSNWIAGSWKAKETYIQKIRDYCQEYIKEIGIPVLFQHVRAHSGVYGNERADQLAGSIGQSHSFFHLLIEQLK